MCDVTCAGVGENKVKDAVRTSETAWLMNKNEPIVATVRNRVAELVQLPMNFAEDMQVVCTYTYIYMYIYMCTYINICVYK